MRLLLLCDPLSSHSQKWISGLYDKGAEVFVVSLRDATNISPRGAKAIFSLFVGKDLDYETEGSIKKINYLLKSFEVKKIIKKIKPDIVHAYYVSSYGALGALTNFHPYFISVWGSDVMSFPFRGFLQKKLIQFALNKADRIFATSKILVSVTEKYTQTKIHQIPFGIDLEKFICAQKLKVNDEIIIGSVKNLDLNYGLDILIELFAKLVKRNLSRKLKLQLIGNGKDKSHLQEMVKKLGIEQNVDFIGYIEQSELPKYYSQMHIFANLSRRESFGVSVLEASACRLPVVVSDIDGLKEVYENNVTGLSVNLSDETDCVTKFQSLIDDEHLRNKLGNNGRKFVEEKYDWKNSVEMMWNHYQEELSKQ